MLISETVLRYLLYPLRLLSLLYFISVAVKLIRDKKTQ